MARKILYSVKLHQKNTKGDKVKLWEGLAYDDGRFETTSGLQGGKIKEPTVKLCKAMNVGKANELSPAEQAVKELKAKEVLKKKEGYIDQSIPLTQSIVSFDPENFIDIPSNMVIDKPEGQVKLPKDAIENLDNNYIGQIKRDGNFVWVVRNSQGDLLLKSRALEDVTLKMYAVFGKEEVQNSFSNLPNGTIAGFEFTYTHKKGEREDVKEAGKVLKASPETLTKKHVPMWEKAKKNGDVGFIWYFINFIYFDGLYKGDADFQLNHDCARNLLSSLKNDKIQFGFDEPTGNIIGLIAKSRHQGLEGIIIRHKTDSKVNVSFGGKPKRGGGWKYKFTLEEDCFITEYLKGKSGRHASVYAKFKLAQYDKDGKIIDRGYCGPGKLTQTELEVLEPNINQVVEIEHRGIQRDSDCFVHPVLQRLRHDKKHKECIYEN